MTSHHFHNEGALMWGGSASDSIDALDYPMKSSIRTDGHVRAAEIIVDRTDHTNNMQVSIFFCLVWCDLSCW